MTVSEWIALAGAAIPALGSVAAQWIVTAHERSAVSQLRLLIDAADKMTLPAATTNKVADAVDGLADRVLKRQRVGFNRWALLILPSGLVAAVVVYVFTQAAVAGTPILTIPLDFGVSIGAALLGLAASSALGRTIDRAGGDSRLEAAVRRRLKESGGGSPRT